MVQSKRILIQGYYGFSNAGDEAVLSAIIAGLRLHVGDDVEIAVLSASPEETADLHCVRALPRTSTVSVAEALRGCDLFISGGGSLIQDATSLRSLVYYLSAIALAKRFGRKVMILGQGIGPLRRSASRRLARKVLSGTDLITVRDARSAELLGELGVCNVPIVITADPSLLLTPCPPEESLRLLSEAGIGADDDVIAVSLREWPESPEIERAVAEALGTVSEKLCAKLLLIAMRAPDDELLAKRVEQTVGRPEQIVVQPRAWTPSQLLGVLGRCRLVVGMRLHALIFAAAVGVPCLGIVYDPKVAGFLTAADQESVTLEQVASGALADEIIKAWHARDELASRLSGNLPAMREAAAENFRLAGGLIGE